MSKKDEALKLALEALRDYRRSDDDRVSVAMGILQEALAEQPAPVQQEPVAWSVINPAGEIVATEKDAIHGWARLGGFKPTLEGLLGFHDQGWRVVPASPPASKPWVGLTDEEIEAAASIAFYGYMTDKNDDQDQAFARAIEAKLWEKNA